MTTLNYLTIRSFRAPHEPKTTKEYLIAHSKVLAGIGVDHAFRKNERWTKDPDSIIVVATTFGNRLIGGIRLQLHKDKEPLGMLTSIQLMDPKVVPMFDAWARRGLGELCGLWVLPEFTGHGIARQLLIAAVSLADQCPMNTLVSFGAEYTTRAILNTGFQTIDVLGKNGVFDFPKPGRQSHALVNKHINTCALAPSDFKAQLLALRSNGYMTLRGSSLTGVPSIQFKLDRAERVVGDRFKLKRANVS